MTALSFEEYKIRCREIDEIIYKYLHELIIESLPEDEHNAALMYSLTRIVTKSIGGVYPQKAKQPEVVDKFCKTVKQFLELTKEVTLQ